MTKKYKKSEVLEINADGCLHCCTISKDILTASKHLVLKVTLIILTKQSIYSTARILLLGAVILSSCVFYPN
jgi:hypothetical protein